MAPLVEGHAPSFIYDYFLPLIPLHFVFFLTNTRAPHLLLLGCAFGGEVQELSRGSCGDFSYVVSFAHSLVMIVAGMCDAFFFALIPPTVIS
jgi:hypothetical protein